MTGIIDYGVGISLLSFLSFSELSKIIIPHSPPRNDMRFSFLLCKQNDTERYPIALRE